MFWPYVKYKTDNRSIPSDMINNGVKLLSPGAQPSGFKEYFHSTFSNPLNDTGNDHEADTHSDLNAIIITEQEVTSILQKYCKMVLMV